MNIATIIEGLSRRDPRAIGRAISIVENHDPDAHALLDSLDPAKIEACLVVGITGPPGAGKSTLTAQLIKEYRRHEVRVGIVAVDPSSPLSGGALLGDRVRMMNHALDPDVVIRSMATRGRLGGVCGSAGAAVRIMAHSACQVVLIETVGVGQSEMDIVRMADLTAMVLAPGLGDDIQAMKAGLLEVADVLVVNKADLRGADALLLDMESVAQQRQDRQGRTTRVCATIASKGDGVAELVQIFNDMNEMFQKSGEKAQRRLQARRYEVIDWAVELIRPRIADSVADKAAFNGDPMLLAQDILVGMGLQTKKD
ncbi:MAG: methylmalonyl Co-A mutase-associated GTPase MeaB [Proteobacteria bacterium]|nr:methylmalonyl Co-A mutase-associated GTPase MeaB [Pseudomonadota bacterium]MBU1641696.1 methylmalonyl Co-A mutase-associated GTPase MeaB [Pseudomonadota bacterium]